MGLLCSHCILGLPCEKSWRLKNIKKNIENIASKDYRQFSLFFFLFYGKTRCLFHILAFIFRFRNSARGFRPEYAVKKTIIDGVIVAFVRRFSSLAGFPSTTRFSRTVKSYKSGRTRGKIFGFFRSQGGCTCIVAFTRAKPSSPAASFSTMGPSTDKPASISWRWGGFSSGPRVIMPSSSNLYIQVLKLFDCSYPFLEDSA